MAFSVSEITAKLNKHGIAKNNVFVVRILLTNEKLTFLSDKMDVRELTFLCRSATLPEIGVQTQDFRPRGYGPAEKRPTGFELPALPAVFMVDSNFGVTKFFHRWMQEVVNYDVSAGYMSESTTGLRPYEFGYRDDYACTIQIDVYSGNQTDKFYTYTFNNAYPVTIGSTEVAWENAAEIMVLPVQFAYDELKVEATERGSLTKVSSSGGNGLLGFLSSINTFGQVLNGVKRPRNIQDAINVVSNVNLLLGSLK